MSTTANIELIKNNHVDSLQLLLKPEEKIFQSKNELIKYILQEIDLSDFLGLSMGYFQCVFHNHRNNWEKTANIFITELGGKYYYNCNEPSCEFQGDIIDCVTKIRNCNRQKAIEFVCSVYRLSYQTQSGLTP